MPGTTARDFCREGAAAPLVPIVRHDSMAAYVMTHYEGGVPSGDDPHPYTGGAGQILRWMS